MAEVPVHIARSGEPSSVSPTKRLSHNKENARRSTVTSHGISIVKARNKSSTNMCTLPAKHFNNNSATFSYEILTCPACSEHYSNERNEKKPRILPFCGHTLCEECLRKALSNSKETLICFSCKRQNSLVSHKKVEDFPFSWASIDILEQLAKKVNCLLSEDPNVEQCSYCKKHEVSHLCRLHSSKMCAYCAFKHMKECKKEKICECCELPCLLKKAIASAQGVKEQLQEKKKQAQTIRLIIENELSKKIEELIAKLLNTKGEILSKIELYSLQIDTLQEDIDCTIHTSIGNTTNDSISQKTMINALNKLDDLLSKTGDISQFKLEFAFNNKNFDELLKKFENSFILSINSPLFGSFSNDVYQCLFAACAAGNGKIADFLISKRKLDVNYRDQSGATPMITSAINGKKFILNLLNEKYKANVDLQDNVGNTALMYASQLGIEDIAAYLVKVCKANTNLQNNCKNSALHCAIDSGNLSLVKLLVEDGQVNIGLLNAKGKRAVEANQIV